MHALPSTRKFKGRSGLRNSAGLTRTLIPGGSQVFCIQRLSPVLALDVLDTGAGMLPMQCALKVCLAEHPVLGQQRARELSLSRVKPVASSIAGCFGYHADVPQCRQCNRDAL